MSWDRCWQRLTALVGRARPTARRVRARHLQLGLERLEERLPPATGLPSLSASALPARFANAAPLDGNGEVQGTLTAGQPQDYSVTVSSDSFLIGTAVPESSPGFEPRLSLYDGAGQLLIEADQQGPGLASTTVDQHLQPGTYYLEVSAAASSAVTTLPQAYELTTALAASLPSFAPLAVGNSPAAVSVADLGNGHPDIVTANAGDNTVSVLLGNGDGTFQPVQAFAVGSEPVAVTVADLGNGHPDIVTANEFDNTVSVLLGNGDGTFQPEQALAVGNDPVAVAVADLGNGHPDIVTANQGDNTVSVLLGNGDGTFGPGQAIAVGNGPVGVAIADLGNGHPDIVTANEFDNTVSVLLGNGDGTFQPALPVAVDNQPSGVVVADLGNGHPDIVVTDEFPVVTIGPVPQSQGTVTVLLGNGDGTFQPAQSYAVGSDPTGVAVADLGNGHPDIVTANQGDNTVSVLLGNGAGTFQPAQAFAAGSQPSAVTVADLGNGWSDIITANENDNSVSVLLGNGDGTVQPALSFAVGTTPAAVAVADLGNGHPDIVTANESDNTVSVLLGNGDGTFQPAQSYPVAGIPVSLAVVDVNGDGRPDIVTASEGISPTYIVTVSVLLGNGDGTFQPAQSFLAGRQPPPDFGQEDGPVSVAVADLGNGHPDIVTAFQGGSGVITFDKDISLPGIQGGTVSVLLGNGDGTFQLAQSFAVGSRPSAVAVANLGNGHPDIVTANEDDSTVSVLLGDGDGTFQPAQTFAVGAQPSAVAVADLGNGHPDIVTANESDNTVSVLLGNGDGTFQPAQAFAVGNGPVAVAVMDLGNGHLDIVTANKSDNTVSVLLGNGDGTFQPAQAFAVGSEPVAVALADLGNGLPDIVTANDGSNTVSVLLNQGNAQFQAPAGPSGIPSRDIPQLQDLTDDGIPDAVSLDQRTGQVLFREGTGDPSNPFAPFVVVNPGRPATDFTLVQTPGLPEIAVLDAVDQEVFVYAWSRLTAGFYEIGAFATGPQPVRIASADLDGNGLGDLVVGNDQDNTLTIALQQSPGSFDTFTRGIGAGPSSIAFADLNGDSLPDIVVSDQVSGDVSILFNDAGHSFTTQERYRAGQGPFDISTGPNGTSVLSQLQTVGVVAGDFTGTGSTDLVALDANSDSFSLLRAAGGGSLIDPQVADSYLVGQGAVQALAGDFLHNGRQDLAVLVTRPDGTSQVLVFPNNGDATFGQPIISAAGADASGFSFLLGQAGQPDRLVVGDNDGDFLVLVGNGAGDFVVDRSGLDGKPLAVFQPKGGPPLVVVANEQTGQVQVFAQTQGSQSGTGSLAALSTLSVPASSITQAQASPGSVLLTDLTGDGLPDLVVADRLGNDVLVFPGNASGTFGPPAAFPVGFEPDAITVGDFNSDGIPDLAVANQGSNDISILLGSIDPSTGLWTATAGPRLNSGGSEPLAVQAGTFTGRPGILDLRVTNAGGQIATIPGIGSSGHGSGFFDDTNPRFVNVGSIIDQVAFDPSTGEEFLVLQDGELISSRGTVLVSSAVAAVSADNGFLAVGLDSGTVEVLAETGGLAGSQSEFDQQPSALQALQEANRIDVFATYQGQDVPVVYSFAIPVLTELPATAVAIELSSLDESSAALIAVVVKGSLVEQLIITLPEPIPGAESFALFLPLAQLYPTGTPPGAEDAPDQNVPIAEVGVVPYAPANPEAQTPLRALRLAADQGLRQYSMERQLANQIEDLLDAVQKLLTSFKSLLEWPANLPANPTALQAPDSKQETPRVAEEPEEPTAAEPAGPAGLEARMEVENALFARLELLPARIAEAWPADREANNPDLMEECINETCLLFVW